MAMGWWMAIHMNKNVCGVKLPTKLDDLQDKDVKKAIRRERMLRNITCELMPGHPGNHMCRTKTCTYQWWNESCNPQIVIPRELGR